MNITVKNSSNPSIVYEQGKSAAGSLCKIVVPSIVEGWLLHLEVLQSSGTHRSSIYASL